MIGRLFTKYEFNKLCKHWNLIKLTNQFENHNGYQFKTWSNIDNVPFNAIDYCIEGGIYFCHIENLSQWFDYGIEIKGKWFISDQ